MNLLQGLIKEKDGTVSSMRTIFMLCPLIVLAVWVAVNIINTLHGQSGLIDIPQNVLLLIGGLTAGKVSQKFAEGKGDNGQA